MVKVALFSTAMMRRIRRFFWSVFLLLFGFVIGVTAGNDIVRMMVNVAIGHATKTTPETSGFNWPWEG